MTCDICAGCFPIWTRLYLIVFESRVHSDTVAHINIWKLPSETIGHRAAPLTPHGVNVLTEGHLSGGNEAGEALLFHFTFGPAAPQNELSTSPSQSCFPIFRPVSPNLTSQAI